jgi:hypothetical protein
MSILHLFRQRRPSKRLLVLAVVAGLLVLLAGLFSTSRIPSAEASSAAQSATPTPQGPVGHVGMMSNSIDCLVCHSNPDLMGSSADGQEVSLAVDQDVLNASMHGRLGCGACHRTIKSYPHTDGQQAACSLCHTNLGSGQPVTYPLPHPNLRAQTAKLNEGCYTCHELVYKKFLTGMHARNLNGGNTQAPLCVDCHGSHDVKAISPDSFAQSCGDCHQAIYSSYANSMHAVKAGEAGDAPTCADCHGEHSITGPRDPDFRRASLVKCLECHQDEALMAKYDVPADLFDPNVDDYHFVPVSMFDRVDVDIAGRAPVCYDCHGMHNIRPSSDPASLASSANLTRNCRQCHPETGRDLTGLGPAHSHTTSTVANVVNGIKQVFSVMIPGSVLVMVGLMSLDAGKRLRERGARRKAQNLDEA